MRRLIPLLLAMACAKEPSVQKVLETPAAKDQRHPTEAPSASTSDQDRNGVRENFEDMSTTQEAYRQARPEQGSGAGSGTAAHTTGGYPPRFPAKEPPKKVGPAVEAPKE